MPRISAEARAAAALRAGGTPPTPPAHLGKDAKAVWIKIAASKPADWFDDGAQVLLERYCETTVQARRIAKRLEALMKAGAWKDAKEFEKRLVLMSQAQTTLATKLRLSVQAIMDRRSGKVGERGVKASEPDRLLGGQAVWGDSAKVN